MAHEDSSDFNSLLLGDVIFLFSRLHRLKDLFFLVYGEAADTSVKRQEHPVRHRKPGGLSFLPRLDAAFEEFSAMGKNVGSNRFGLQPGGCGYAISEATLAAPRTGADFKLKYLQPKAPLLPSFNSPDQ